MHETYPNDPFCCILNTQSLQTTNRIKVSVPNCDIFFYKLLNCSARTHSINSKRNGRSTRSCRGAILTDDS
jgi:hypothetical protein